VPTEPWRWDSPVTLGTKFRSDAAGRITAIRYWKASASDTGSHIGVLYNSAGQLLAQAVFPATATTGWQTATFATPVTIAANTTYVAAYWSNSGWSSDGTYFLNQGADAPPLHALRSGVDGPNGLYAYGSAPTFPTASRGANYWVDVVYAP
jgi:hypothetical protein